jgi:CARDB
MNRTRIALPALLILVVLLVAASAAGAMTKGQALPDLVVKKVSKPPKAGVVGSKVKLVVKIQNAGSANAGKSKLGLYLGKGKKHTKKDKRLKRVKVKPLAAGKGKTLKLRVTLPAKSKLGSYRLFACADDTKKVSEAKERNCKASRKIKLVAKAVPVPPAAAAFTMSDGLDWGFVSDAKEEQPDPGDPVALTLTTGNGIPGQAGYSRSDVGVEGFRNGNSTTLAFGSGNEDDGQVTLQLPFAFPFGGIREQTISVSTNGWVSFGSPAWDYWDDVQPSDYRGVPTVVGELERGIMPYWADLDVGEPSDGAGTVKQVVAPDNSWVAYQWDTYQHSEGTTARRSFQLVLFPNGGFRYDYPGENAAGGNKSFVGYSLGTGAASTGIVSAEGDSVPSGSLLFTPNAVPAAGPTAAGTVTALLPKGSAFVSADAGCTLATAPGQFSTGLVSCQVPALAAGEQTARTVTFAMPGDAPGQTNPANFRLLGTYLGGGIKLTDGDEVDRITTSLQPSEIGIKVDFATPPLEAGAAETIDVEITSKSSGLDEPTAKFDLTNAAFSSIEIDGTPIECTPPSGGSVSCVLPSGMSKATVEVNVVPSGLTLELKTTAQALNAPTASLGIGFAA